MDIRYDIGDIIEYEAFGGLVRRVVVEEKLDDIKNGRPGFHGAEVGVDYGDGPLDGVWGYDSQITRVITRS
jgi:hypothetical protein